MDEAAVEATDSKVADLGHGREHRVPRIAAPTVAEHRALVRTRLIDAAEQILRSSPSVPLTAGAVTAGAGIARNSIYRYVDSVEDLRGLVVERYLPDWLTAVEQAMAGADTPEDRVVAWVRSNLEQAAGTGHGWLMDAVRATSPSATLDGAITDAHSGMHSALTQAWGDLLHAHPDHVPIATGLTAGLLEAGFRQLDQGRPITLVVDLGTAAARALTASLPG